MPIPARTKTNESLSRGVKSWHTHASDGVMNMTLTTLNSPSRSYPVLPRTFGCEPSPTSAIFPIRNFKAYSSTHDVPIPLRTQSASPTQSNVSGPTTSTSTNVSLKPPSTTPPRVPDLAAQHGIPMVLPKAPNTAPRSNIASISQQPIADFTAVKNNYLKMLAASSPKSVSTSTLQSVDKMQTFTVQHTPEQKEAAEFFESVIGDTSPLFSDAGDDFLTGNTTPGLGFDTSPFETPYDDFLTTPLFQDVGEPLISDQMDLFGGTDFGALDFSTAPAPEKVPLNVDALFTLSPTTPMLDSIDPSLSIYPSPRLPSDTSFAPSSQRNKPTGTRKNISPETMVPLDAPTQPRQYRTPSATSRKELPATFAKKRTRSQAFGDDDDDELEPEALGPNATEAEQIEYKRRQNTIAARKSRKRKLEYQQGLENKVEELKVQLEQWRVRAEIYAGVLRSHGLAAAALPPM